MKVQVLAIMRRATIAATSHAMLTHLLYLHC